MPRALLLLPFALGAACFSPRIPACAFDLDAAACLAAPDAARTVDARVADAKRDAGSVDARPPADAALPVDARADARPADARTIDAPPMVDAPVDAPIVIDAGVDAPLSDAQPVDCTAICSGERACGQLGACFCGDCGNAAWCGTLCGPAICESNNCCLPESSPCTSSDQCCAGLSCAIFCSKPL